jgi:hypothetical protein
VSSAARLAAIALTIATSVVACGGDTSAAVRPHCTRPPAGEGPDASATLHLADAGSTVCLARNAALTVLLEAPSGGTPWSRPRASDRHVLVPTANGALALPLGVTGAAFRGGRAGTATIEAVRAPCTVRTIRSCDAAHVWRARVVVH